MAKSLTQWGNNDTKNGSQWSSATKSASMWGKVTKSLTQFTSISKNVAEWSATTVKNTYTYDNANIPYDSASYAYDYTPPITNQLNTKNTTQWSVSQ